MLSQTNEITLNNEVYKIVYWLAGDMKALLTILGLKQANSLNPYVLCVSDKETFSSHIHPINRDYKNPRIDTLVHLNIPILKFIIPNKIIIDVLNLTMRITDRVFKITLDEIASIKVNFQLFISLIENLKY